MSENRIMRRLARAKILTFGLAAAGLSACQNLPPEAERADRFVDQEVWSVPSRTHPPERLAIVVKQSDVSDMIPFRPRSAVLTADARASVAALVARSGARTGDTAVVAIHGAGPGGPALAARRTAAVAAVLRRHGLKVERNLAGNPATPDTATVAINRTVASVPGCPEWGRLMATMTVDEYRPRFGCLTASTLAASLDEPRDLEGGRPLGKGHGPVYDRGVRDLRDGKLDPKIAFPTVGSVSSGK
jgi:pilus biogenesis lipoprotein CpaD